MDVVKRIAKQIMEFPIKMQVLYQIKMWEIEEVVDSYKKNRKQSAELAEADGNIRRMIV